MKLLLAGIVLFLIVEANAQWYKFPGQAVQGSRDMWRAYRDMKKENVIGADKFFHARGNYDAAQRGAGGRFAARVISDGRAAYHWIKDRDLEEIARDQEANRWGRNGGDPRRSWRYWVNGLPHPISEEDDYQKNIFNMKLLLAGIVLFLIVETNAQWYNFPGEAVRGSRDMWRAYRDMKDANWKNSDKYFHARGNYDAAQRGAGGRWAAKVISDVRERGAGDSAADQEANEWGRNGGDPNHYRPPGLPSKY
ncbi:uncharacterized protein [Pagrus major]|uniref:uncharacterized protein n=1 Tax=Pagrus major TaxID=143350 RepID=UPI003CC8BA23